METRAEICQNTGNRAVTCPSCSALGYVPKGPTSTPLRDTHTLLFTMAIVNMNDLWSKLICLTTEEWIKKM